MGKRKKSSRKPQGPKKRDPLATSFRCVFCNNETSVSVKIDRKARIASLSCKSCGQSYQAGADMHTHPVDTYAEWIDACESVQNNEAAEAMASPTPAQQHQAKASARAGLAPGETMTAEDAGFIDDDDEDPEAAYADE